MIRKMLVVAAAVAMPATVLAGVTGAGIASAKAGPAETGSVPLTGTVAFAAPGISAPGTITNKTAETTTATITPSGFGGTKAIKTKIVSATSACWATLPVYSKTSPVGGTLAAGAASSCDVGGASAAGDPTIVAADVKTAIKDKYYYDSALSFVSGSTISDLTTALAGGLKVENNGNKGVFTLSPGGATAVDPGGVCGADAGFQLVGTDGFVGATNATIYVCLSGDTGPGTTGSFVTDLVGGSATIATALVGGDSAIVYSA